MGHAINAKEEIYHALAERLSKAPEGAKVNEEFMELLYSLYTESQAMVASKFPLVPMTLNKISSITEIKENELKIILEEMSKKGLILDIPRKDSVYYMLAPFVVGFFEYTFMRTGDQIKLKELAELFEKYFNSDGAFEEIAGIDTKIMRTLVYENVIPVAVETEVLLYERATKIVREAGGGSLSVCQCRHQASHLGTACDAPQDVCISLGGAAKWLVSKGLAKPATVEELLEVLEETQKYGLVHLCDNVMNKPTYICSCCSCCCHMIRGVKEKQTFSFHSSNFIATIELENCINCGVCVDKCPIDAITMLNKGKGKVVTVVNNELCIGCGVCASVCPTRSLDMSRRSVLHIPPKDIKEKLKRMAIENGRI
ncbi:4Fe-4S dicluster domain-containing protein [Clostridium sediminicola]|uniref:ATP-binding protein n=1 Tax=Clostridium sediminicola TaxID=3114879 RepID=UPI0031F1CB56